MSRPLPVATGGPRTRRRALLTLVTLACLVIGIVTLGRVGPTAQAVSFPIRVASRAHVTAAGPHPVDYPYRVRRSLSFDAYGFVVGQCTSFAAWWLNSHHVRMAVLTVGPSGTGRFLNASGWDRAARAAGFRVGSKPVVGAVAQWHAGERALRSNADGILQGSRAGRDGHVAVVLRVLPNGSAVWAEFGWQGKPRLHIGSGWAPRYLYLGVSPPA